MTDYNREEAKRAKRDGAKVVPNSGRGMFQKGDAKTSTLLIDYKFTEKGSFSINLDKFKKHEKDAWREQRHAAIVVVFEAGRELAIMDWDRVKELEEKAWMYDDLCS